MDVEKWAQKKKKEVPGSKVQNQIIEDFSGAFKWESRLRVVTSPTVKGYMHIAFRG